MSNWKPIYPDPKAVRLLNRMIAAERSAKSKMGSGIPYKMADWTPSENFYAGYSAGLEAWRRAFQAWMKRERR